MSQMRFGVLNFCRSPYHELVQRIRQFESMGFDSAWVDDDVLTPGYVDYEAWTLLGALAVESSLRRWVEHAWRAAVSGRRGSIGAHLPGRDSRQHEATQ